MRAIRSLGFTTRDAAMAPSLIQEGNMVAPIQGPFKTTRIWTDESYYPGYPAKVKFNEVWRYKQKPPFNIPLDYWLDWRKVVSFTDPGGPNYREYTAAMNYIDSWTVDSSNKALAKLQESVGSESLWAVNIRERAKTMSLLEGSAMRLYQFARNLRRGNIPSAIDALGLKDVRDAYRAKGLLYAGQPFANAFLAVHFGVEPLVKDIGAAVETLQHDFADKQVRVRATERHTFSTRVDVGPHWNRYRYYSTTNTQLGCTLRVTNPNLYLANQLGFLNPATFVWESIPFSFVADWFGTVGQFLASFSGFAGVSILDPFHTRKQTNLVKEDRSNGIRGDYASFYLWRTRDLPSVTLKLRPWKDVSPTRAATAISLLLQQLR